MLFGRTPALNWDGIAYVALALEREADPREAHRQSYAYLEATASGERYVELTATSSYRVAMAVLPDAFAENLRFYRMRFGYVGLLAGLHRMTGVNPYHLSVGIGVGAFLLLAGAVWAWAGHALRGGEKTPWLRLAALPLLLHPGALAAIALTTPDLLAGALLAWGAFFVSARRELATGGLFFLLAVLCRPDALILGASLLALPAVLAFLARRRGDVVPPRAFLLPLGLAGALGLAGLLLVRLGGAHPWSTVFTHTFLQNTIVPGGEGVGLGAYLLVVARAIVFLGSGLPARILFCLVALATAYLLWQPRFRSSIGAYAAAALAAWCAFFFLFPLPLERFYLAHVVIVGGLLLQGVAAPAPAREVGRALGAPGEA